MLEMLIAGEDNRATSCYNCHKWFRLTARVTLQMFGSRVLIFSSPHLFAQAIRHLVAGNGFNVVGLEPYTDEAPSLVQSLRPDIIILNGIELSPLQLTSLLDYAPTVRVIRLESDGNRIRVYDRHQLDVCEAQDFVNILCMPDEFGR